MARVPFSQRYGTTPEKQPAPREEVPPWVRGEVAHHIEMVVGFADLGLPQPFQTLLYEKLRPMIWKVLGEPPTPGSMVFGGGWDWPTIKSLIERAEWDDFYEICESAYELVRNKHTHKADAFETELNKLFAVELLPWVLKDGMIEVAYPAEIVQIFEDVKGLLADHKYSGPNDQFRKANQHLSGKPNPDTENCIKDAVGALEGVARIISEQPKLTLGQLLNRQPLKSSLPTLLRLTVEKLWAYRSDEPGIGHGKTDVTSVGIQEAQWVLSMCATTMVYLGQRFPGE